ncbi:hypothetical protein RJD24_15050 [Bacillaceae bacterium IKA-2]|nr:hypothetical protein RJD24_15050 [Bacillaceae bacterium IKA-2]
MGAKQVIIGLVIFIFVTVASFMVLNQVLQLSDVISVMFAIVIGLGAELLYRKKARII